MPSMTWPITPSIAPTSTLLRSCARIAALAFFVPKVSPKLLRASRNARAVGAGAGGIDLSALTVWLRICGVRGVGYTVSDAFLGLWMATRYLDEMSDI